MEFATRLTLAAAFAASVAIGPATAADAPKGETPKRGGTLTYLIPADAPPSFDGHREQTYATVHATAPFYSVLIRVNPETRPRRRFRLRSVHRDPGADRRRQDLYVQYPRRSEVPRWHAADRRRCRGELAADHRFRRKASSAHASAISGDGRQGRSPDPTTVVFHLKFATTAFLPMLADPFAYIYKKDILEKDPHWYEKNIMGSGPFKFVGYEAGQSIKGERNPDYYHQGLPYLDGFVGIFAPKQATRVDAIRADRAATEFRGMPPSARDELIKELGDKITVQDKRLELRQPVHPTIRRSRSTTVRVRRALALAIDQWNGAPALSKIATVHTVGGIVFPGSPLAATKEELQKIAGFWPDIEKSRAEAKRLLKEAGAENLNFELLNRDVDQPYKYVATWRDRRMEQDRPQGDAESPTDRAVVFERMRSGNFDVTSITQSARASSTRRSMSAVPSSTGLRRELRRLRGPTRRSSCTTRCCTKPIRRSSAQRCASSRNT